MQVIFHQFRWFALYCGRASTPGSIVILPGYNTLVWSNERRWESGGGIGTAGAGEIGSTTMRGHRCFRLEHHGPL